MARLSPNDYRLFDEGDFIADHAFQQWVIDPAAEDLLFWAAFLRDHPHKAAIIEQARDFLLQIRFEQEVPDLSRAQASFQRHLAQVEAPGTPLPAVRGGRIYTRWMQVAALVAGLVLITAAFLLLNRPAQQHVSTQYGQLRKLLLPDSSLIVLNAHSTVRYQERWQAGRPREVWLEGEAFFNVRHLNHDRRHVQPGEQFLVHTPELDITVLGTTFDIRQRRGKTEIVLQTGRIRVSFRDTSRAAFVMAPGDLVRYDPARQSLERTTTAPQDYTAWKEKKLVLQNPAVSEIITYLEDNYGKKIVLQDGRMASRIIEGPIMLGNLDDALFILSAVLNTRIVKKGDQVMLTPVQ